MRTEPVDRSKSAAPSEFRPDIEGLRGLAILLVLVFHASTVAGWSLFSGGFVGVDIFFVISGYLITGLLLREYRRNATISFSRFYARRVRRILPAALVVVVISLILTAVLLPPLSRPSAILDGISSALSIGNLRLAMTANYFNQVGSTPFLHFWSLGVEEQFYLVWPALIAGIFILGQRFWPRHLFTGLAALLLGLIGLSLALNLIWSDSSPTMAFYLLPTRAWQLACGGLLAWAVETNYRPRFSLMPLTRAVAGWLAMLALITFFLCFDIGRPVPYPSYNAVLPTVAGLILIAVGQNAIGPGWLFRTRPMRFLGRISYSLYLWHWPVLVLGALILAGPLAQSLSFPLVVALVLISVVLAYLSWRFIEEPFRTDRIGNKRYRLRLPSPRRLIAAGLVAMTLVTLVGGVLNWQADSVLINAGTAYTRPAIAAADIEAPLTDGCYGHEDDVSPHFASCHYGQAGAAYQVALVGDSHASALFPALDSVAQARGWGLTVLVKSSCLFSDLPMYNLFLEREYRECASWNTAVLAYLQAHPVNLVVVSGNHVNVNLSPTDGSIKNIAAGQAREIAQIPVTTKAVIVIDPPQPWSVNVPICLSVYPDQSDRCAFSRTASGTDIGLREADTAAAGRALTVTLTDQICPGAGNCPAIINNLIVWRDANHLTASFSRSLGPVLDQRIAAALSLPEK